MLKRTILIALFFLAGSYYACAQFLSAVKTGVNICSLVPYEGAVDNHLGFSIGWEGEYDPLDWLGARFGLAISQKGSGLRVPDSDFINHIPRTQLGYLLSPASLVLKGRIHDFTVAIGGGLYYAYLISGNADLVIDNLFGGGTSHFNVMKNEIIEYTSPSGETHREMSLKRFNQTDYGGQVLLDLSYRSLSVGVSYQHGWKIITDQAPFVMMNGCHNECWSVHIGYYLKH